MVTTALHKVHALLDVRACLAVVVLGMGFIGVEKARGKMPHPASRAVGRFEFMGAMFMLMPSMVMQGLGRIAGACVILCVMGAMVAIKPKALVTELTFITLTSKILASEWSTVTEHKHLTDNLAWEVVMAFAVCSGLLLGGFVKITGAGNPKVRAKKAESVKKRSKRA